ncbi:MAG: hypothetical protein KFF50_01915 [Desulfatitalea sp.]|nr:hypothetical protein [Desulfatitalea sp.]
MNPYYLAYNLFGAGIGAVLRPLLWLYARRDGHQGERYRQRFGHYTQALPIGGACHPRIWLHAVSVGEVGVATAIAGELRALLPHCHMVLSTTTLQGLARAKAQLDADTHCFYAPLDLLGPTRKAIRMVRPDVLALLETEIWPNLIVSARRSGARTAILNGRISVRAIHRYRKIQPLMAHVLGHIDCFSMISSADAQRIESLGAAKNRVLVNGNAKFDSPDPKPDGDRIRQWALRLYGLQEDTPVFVAGSTRNPEERTLLEAFIQMRRLFPQLVLVIAPRHIHRVAQVAQWVREKGLACQRRSTLARESRSAPVVLLDTIGELSATYSVARFVFCGGSLVPKGGQNLLEPALWGKPVMYGDSMEDFADARALIQRAGGGFTVHNAEQMAALAVRWLQNPESALAAGQAARQAIQVHRGAARQHAAVIARLLQN